MSTVEPEPEPEQIWPKPRNRPQTLMRAGTRSDRDPALLPCQGACGKQGVRWTWHHIVNSSTFQCDHCSTSRRWGLGFSY